MKKEIIDLRMKGLSYNDISKIMSCSKSTISYHCSKIPDNDIIIHVNNLIKSNLFQSDFVNVSKEEIIKVYILRKSKKTYSQIEYETKISLIKIKKICRIIEMTRYKNCVDISDKQITEIVQLYSELKSIRKVANKLKISTHTIRKYIIVEKMTEREAKKNRSLSVINWRKRKKIELVEYKGGSCEICGYNKCIQSLSFHHIDKKTKEFTISGKSWSFERLKKEVDKCILICHNCHGEIHNQ